jgi:hypothetical protein
MLKSLQTFAEKNERIGQEKMGENGGRSRVPKE